MRQESTRKLEIIDMKDTHEQYVMVEFRVSIVGISKDRREWRTE